MGIIIKHCKCRNALITCENIRKSRTAAPHCLNADGVIHEVGEEWIQTHAFNDNLKWCQGEKLQVLQAAVQRGLRLSTTSEPSVRGLRSKHSHLVRSVRRKSAAARQMCSLGETKRNLLLLCAAPVQFDEQKTTGPSRASVPALFAAAWFLYTRMSTRQLQMRLIVG